MDPTLADLLADEVDLTALSDEDLAARRDALTSAATEARENADLTGEVIALLAASAAQVGEISVEQDERARIAAELIEQADAAMAALDAINNPPEVEEIAAEDETVEVAAADDTETADEPEVPAEPEVAAAAEPKKLINRAVKVPARHQPRIANMADRAARPILKATAESVGVTAGHVFENPNDMNEAMFEKWLSLSKSGDGMPHMTTRMEYKHMFSPEQTLYSGAPDEITDKVLAYVQARRDDINGGGDGSGALNRLRVASGGVPGPAEPRYGQITYGQADRPLRDALPNFLAARGQIVYNGSPTLADIVLDTGAGAIGTVTSAQDASGATKDIQEISAPTATTVTVEAETMRFSQGNFADRFFPERTAAFMRLGQVAYARHNDALRLADIKTNCTKYTDTPAIYGAYRDLKRQFLGQTEQLEDLVRDFNMPVRVLMPEFVPAMLAADMATQQAGDGTYLATEEGMRADMESWDPNVNITWLKDSIRGRLSTSPSGQSPRSAGFDADVEWAMFPEGAFLFLDGGQLDLGIIRDTVVSATNKFQTFYESWEAVAPLISSTLCFWMTSSLCADGAAQVATSIGKCSAGGS